MVQPRPSLPAWLIALDVLAVVLLAGGIARIADPAIPMLSDLPEAAAYAAIAVGGICLGLFWMVFLRFLKARRAG